MIGIQYAVGPPMGGAEHVAAMAAAVTGVASVEAAAVAEPRVSIDQLAERSAQLRADIAADRRWVAAERPHDMGDDLMVGLGITTMDAIRQQRQRFAA